MANPTGTRISRQTFLRALGGAGFVLPLLSACASGATAPAAAPTSAASAPTPVAAAPTSAAAATTVPVAAGPTSAPQGAATVPAAAPAASGTSSAADAAFVAAAKPFKGHKVTIMMSAGPWGKSHEQMLPAFNQLTGLNVVYDSIPEPNIGTKLQATVMSRSGEYDAVVMVWDVMAQYIKAGLIADLSTFAKRSDFPQFDITEYPQPIVNFLTTGGKLWGIPVSVAAQISHYRKDLFDAAGLKAPTADTTWQGVYDQGKALTKDGIQGVLMEMSGGGIYAETLNILPADKPILDANRRLSIFRDPRVVSTYETWRRMVVDGVLQKDVLATNLQDAWARFSAGSAAWQPLSWPVAVDPEENPQSSKVAGKVGFAPTPGGTARIGGWGAMVLSDSKEKEAAYVHLAWLAGTETTVSELVQNGNFDAAYTKYIQTHQDEIKPKILARPNGAAEWEGLLASWKAIERGRMVDPTVPEFGSMGNAMYPFLAKIISGELPAADGLNKAADAGEKLLADAGYYK